MTSPQAKPVVDHAEARKLADEYGSTLLFLAFTGEVRPKTDARLLASELIMLTGAYIDLQSRVSPSTDPVAGEDREELANVLASLEATSNVRVNATTLAYKAADAILALGYTRRPLSGEGMEALRCAPPEWLPIESYPRDHFARPIWNEDKGGDCIGFLDITWTWWRKGDDEPLGWTPTHWMERLPHPRIQAGASAAPNNTDLCEDCPPVGYPTDRTRCLPCPRRTTTETLHNTATSRDTSSRRPQVLKA